MSNRSPEAILSMMNEGPVAGYRSLGDPPESNRPLLAAHIQYRTRGSYE
jgi:hypothetical protein